MKKLMTFAVLAAVALSAQAATITWGLGGQLLLVKPSSSNYLTDAVPSIDAGAPEVAAGSYFALVYVGQGKSTFDIESVTTDSIVIDSATTSQAIAAFAVDAYGYPDPFSIDTSTSAFANGASFGVVWFDAGRNKFDYIYSGDDGSALNQTATVDDMSSTGMGDIFPANYAPTSYSGIVAVPEPSTAALALAGLALLLKRRKA